MNVIHLLNSQTMYIWTQNSCFLFFKAITFSYPMTGTDSNDWVSVGSRATGSLPMLTVYKFSFDLTTQ